MNYFSLNHSSPIASFKQAVVNGIAPDRGLYYPESITSLSQDFIDHISEYSNEEIAFEVIKQFIGDETPAEKLKEIIKKIAESDKTIATILFTNNCLHYCFTHKRFNI